MRYASGTRKPENRRTASTSVFENLVEERTLLVIDNCVRPTGNHESSSRRRKGLENGFSKRENAGMEWNGIAMLGNLGELLEDKWLVNDNCVFVQADVKTYRSRKEEQARRASPNNENSGEWENGKSVFGENLADFSGG